MSYAPRRFEDDIYPGYDEDGEDFDNYGLEPDPDLQRDLHLEMEREWIAEALYDDDTTPDKVWVDEYMVAVYGQGPL